MQPFKRSLLSNLAVYGGYLLVAVVMTWPLVTVMGTSFAGYPFGDAHEMTRHIWWMKVALQTGQPLIFQPLLGYPDGMQGVVLWSSPLQFFPGWVFAFFMPLPAAYNLFVLLTLALNGWGAYWLVWKMADTRAAGVLGGLVFMCAPVIQGHLAGGHGNLLVQWPLPLLVYHLLRLTGLHGAQPDASWRRGAWAVVFLVLTTMGHTLQLICAVLPLVSVMGVVLLARRDWRGLLRLMAVSMIGVALVGVYLLPVLGSTFATSAYTGEGGVVPYSLDLLGIVTPSFKHPLYGLLPYTRTVLGVNVVEGSSYIGLVAGVLALIGVWKGKAARWWLLLALVTWVLALGPLLKVLDQPLALHLDQYDTHITLPYALLYNLPGFRLARAPGRFDFLLALVVAVLAGYGWRTIIGQQKKRLFLGATGLVGLLVVLDYQMFWPLPTYNAVIPQAVYDLAASDARAVLDVPWDNLLAAKDALWLQTAHTKPMIAGHVTRRTPVDPAKLTVLENTLNPALLKAAGADVVIVHKFYDTDGKLLRHAREMLGAPMYEDDLLALFTVKTDAAPTLTAVDTVDTVSHSASAYVYAPQSGWLQLRRTAFGIGRKLSLALDGQVIQRWLVNDANSGADVSVNIPLVTAGYHTLTWTLDPPCPTVIDAALDCRTVTLAGVNAEYRLQAAVFGEPVRFDGVTLAASRISVGMTLDVDLLWQFGREMGDTDIRFIKVLDSHDQQVYGMDATLGTQTSAGEWLERVTFRDAQQLPTGEYRVFVGWYTYPDLTRFKVLSAVGGAADGWTQIGTFTVK